VEDFHRRQLIVALLNNPDICATFDFRSFDTAFDRQRTGDIPYVLANLFYGDEPQVEFETHRPPRCSGRGDQYLSEAIRDVERFLVSAQRSLKYDTLRLQKTKLEELAHVLVEFAEDIRNDVGIWRSVEDYNLELFDTRLPLVLEPNGLRPITGGNFF
jgi:hypothetical protein